MRHADHNTCVCCHYLRHASGKLSGRMRTYAHIYDSMNNATLSSYHSECIRVYIPDKLQPPLSGFRIRGSLNCAPKLPVPRCGNVLCAPLHPSGPCPFFVCVCATSPEHYSATFSHTQKAIAQFSFRTAKSLNDGPAGGDCGHARRQKLHWIRAYIFVRDLFFFYCGSAIVSTNPNANSVNACVCVCAVGLIRKFNSESMLTMQFECGTDRRSAPPVLPVTMPAHDASASATQYITMILSISRRWSVPLWGRRSLRQRQRVVIQ